MDIKRFYTYIGISFGRERLGSGNGLLGIFVGLFLFLGSYIGLFAGALVDVFVGNVVGVWVWGIHGNVRDGHPDVGGGFMINPRSGVPAGTGGVDVLV